MSFKEISNLFVPPYCIKDISEWIKRNISVKSWNIALQYHAVYGVLNARMKGWKGDLVAASSREKLQDLLAREGPFDLRAGMDGFLDGLGRRITPRIGCDLVISGSLPLRSIRERSEAHRNIHFRTEMSRTGWPTLILGLTTFLLIISHFLH